MSRRQLKRERMRNIIVQSAHEAFNTNPYDAVNMDHIAERALLSRATLYNYFKNKETLYFEVGLNGWMETGKKLPSFIESEPTGLQKIMKLVPIGFHGVLETPLYYEILRRFLEKNKEASIPVEEQYFSMNMDQIEKLAFSEETILLRYFHELQKYVQIWRDAIELGQIDGSIRNDISSEHLTLLTSMYINGMIEQIVLQKDALRVYNLDLNYAIGIISDNLRRSLETSVQAVEE